jgi:CBS domain-containing protein
MNPSTPIIARLDLMSVEDVMHVGLVGCDPGAHVTEIARILATERIHCVIVHGIERTRAGEHLTWGIVSDQELIAALDQPDAGTTAAMLAVTARPTVERAERLDRAVALMASHHVTHLIVTENDYPIGVLSALDVARAASEQPNVQPALS